MKKVFPFTHFLGILGSFVSGCMSPGIEVGNPDLDGKSVTVKAQGSETLYNIEFIVDPHASVSRISGNLIETVSVVYEYGFPQLSVQATFSDQSQVEVLLTVSKEGEFIDVVLKINGQTIPSVIQSQGSSSATGEGAACLSETNNGALQISEALCAQIVTCLSEVTCIDCQSAVLQLADLGFDFGGDSGQTLGDLEQQIDNGQWEADPTALGQCLNDIPLVPCYSVAASVAIGPPANCDNLRQMIPKPSCSPRSLKTKNNPSGGNENGNGNGSGTGNANGSGNANGNGNGNGNANVNGNGNGNANGLGKGNGKALAKGQSKS